jgi:hypothetical protein
MIALMLYDLRDPPGILLLLFLPGGIKILYFYLAVSCGASDTREGKAAFLRLICAGFLLMYQVNPAPPDHPLLSPVLISGSGKKYPS